MFLGPLAFITRDKRKSSATATATAIIDIMMDVGQNEMADTPARITSAINVYVISLFFVIHEYSLDFNTIIATPFIKMGTNRLIRLSKSCKSKLLVAIQLFVPEEIHQIFDLKLKMADLHTAIDPKICKTSN
jgi:hypothetical protein